MALLSAIARKDLVNAFNYAQLMETTILEPLHGSTAEDRRKVASGIYSEIARKDLVNAFNYAQLMETTILGPLHGSTAEDRRKVASRIYTGLTQIPYI